MFKGGCIMINKNFVVEKSNIFVELKNVNMTLQELRFFSIYLGRINARDISTRCVRFDLSEFREIMNLGRLNIKYLQDATNKLLCKVINISKPSGGYKGFTLFKRVVVDKDESESWYIDIDCSDDALPYFFDLSSSGYVSYRLYNVLSLKSVHQIRLYELFKKYLKIGTVEISISDLRDYLCLNKSYNRFDRFKACIIDDSQTALLANTDICFNYECGKRGSHGKWITIIFHILKNNLNKEDNKIDSFDSENKVKKCQSPNHLTGLQNDISESDIEKLCNMLALKVPEVSERTPELLKKRLELIYSKVIISSKSPIKNPVAYLATCIQSLTTEYLPNISSSSKTKESDDFCVEKYELLSKYNMLRLYEDEGPEYDNIRQETLKEIEMLKAIVKEKTGEEL